MLQDIQEGHRVIMVLKLHLKNVGNMFLVIYKHTHDKCIDNALINVFIVHYR